MARVKKRISEMSRGEVRKLRYRDALLVYELDNGERTNYEIAQEILKKNKSASVLDAFVGEKDVIQSRIGRYKRTAKTYLENVCDGRLV